MSTADPAATPATTADPAATADPATPATPTTTADPAPIVPSWDHEKMGSDWKDLDIPGNQCGAGTT